MKRAHVVPYSGQRECDRRVAPAHGTHQSVQVTSEMPLPLPCFTKLASSKRHASFTFQGPSMRLLRPFEAFTAQPTPATVAMDPVRALRPTATTPSSSLTSSVSHFKTQWKTPWPRSSSFFPSSTLKPGTRLISPNQTFKYRLPKAQSQIFNKVDSKLFK